MRAKRANPLIDGGPFEEQFKKQNEFRVQNAQRGECLQRLAFGIEEALYAIANLPDKLSPPSEEREDWQAKLTVIRNAVGSHLVSQAQADLSTIYHRKPFNEEWVSTALVMTTGKDKA